MKSCGPGGIRTRGLFSAIDEQVGKRGKKLSITSILFQNNHTVLAYLFPNCSRSMKQGMAICKPDPWGFDANNVLEKHRRHFSLSFP